MIERVVIVPGIAMPFFPARPVKGIPLTTAAQAVERFCADMDSGDILQSKLNGDRAGLGIVADADGSLIVRVQNRHGGWLTQKVRNLAAFLALGAGTCLDGEVIDGDFYPFEVLAWGGASLVGLPTYDRARAAQLACSYTGVPFLFSTPRLDFVRRMRANLPRWEGWVRKANLPYPIGHSAIAETTRWSKLKW